MLRLDGPIVRAGMGGVSGHELTAAVSEAGGLGTTAIGRPVSARAAAISAAGGHVRGTRRSRRRRGGLDRAARRK